MKKFKYILLAICILFPYANLFSNGKAEDDETFKEDSPKNSGSKDMLKNDIISYAASQLGKPYSYGKSGPNAFDCSGFISHIFKKFGQKLDRSSVSQYHQGSSVARNDLQPGDLLFFSGRNSNKNKVGHVALATYVDKNTGAVEFIHSALSGGVRYDRIPESKYFEKRYIGARRVL